MNVGTRKLSRFGLAGWLGGMVILGACGLPGIDSAEAATPKLKVDTAPLSRETKLATSFAPVVKKAAASVVNIYTTKKVKSPSPELNPFFNDPLFRRFFGEEPGGSGSGRPRTRIEQSLGSGVLVAEDGYILTNNHVVEGADEIKVSVADGKKEYVAKVVGTDPQTDLAVIKIEGDNLPAITLADSDHLEVGDVVLAVGDPFALGQTVTLGIVSALGRGGFGLVDYEDYIQTDASINPGNSGGALVDAEGRLVGINSFIISRSGGNQGIGFAVPVNMARDIMERIIRDGKVVRGYLGVRIQPVTPELAQEFKLPDESGALIGEVTPKMPAEKAGLKAGDVIVEFDRRKVSDSRNLRLMASRTAPGTSVKVKVFREGKEREFTVKLAELPAEELAKAGRRGVEPGKTESDVLDGVTVADIDGRTRRQFELPPTVKGALVIEVDPDSASANAGLQPGDVILEINRQPITSADEAVQLSEKIKDSRVLLRVWSQGGTRYVVVDESKKRK